MQAKPDLSNCIPSINTGVIFWKKTPEMQALWRLWIRNYHQAIRDVENRLDRQSSCRLGLDWPYSKVSGCEPTQLVTVFDQPPFASSLFSMHVPVLGLGSEWNCKESVNTFIKLHNVEKKPGCCSADHELVLGTTCLIDHHCEVRGSTSSYHQEQELLRSMQRQIHQGGTTRASYSKPAKSSQSSSHGHQTAPYLYKGAATWPAKTSAFMKSGGSGKWSGRTSTGHHRVA